VANSQWSIGKTASKPFMTIDDTGSKNKGKKNIGQKNSE